LQAPSLPVARATTMSTDTRAGLDPSFVADLDSGKTRTLSGQGEQREPWSVGA
jgi:hypothetical protein